MGGLGSGRYYRSSNSTTMEETKRIDIRYMRQHRLLKPNWTGSLSWTHSDGSAAGDIRYSCYADRIVFHYRYRNWGDEWESIDPVVRFDFTPCHIGGSRQWFVCPSCERRCELLCLAGKWPACGKCYRLPYQSQLDDQLSRLQRRQDKLESMLWGKKRKWWRKPKREKLLKEFARVDSLWFDSFAMKAAQLMGPEEVDKILGPNWRDSD